MFEKRFLVVEVGEDRKASAHLSECNLPSEVRYIVRHAEGTTRVFENVTKRFERGKVDET